MKNKDSTTQLKPSLFGDYMAKERDYRQILEKFDVMQIQPKNACGNQQCYVEKFQRLKLDESEKPEKRNDDKVDTTKKMLDSIDFNKLKLNAEPENTTWKDWHIYS